MNHILTEAAESRGGWVVTPNLDIVCQLSRSKELWHLIRRADLLVADGMPLVWASRILGDPLPERVAGSSLVSTLALGAAEYGLSIYLLGGDPGTSEAAAAALRDANPGLRIAGTYCPPFGFEKDDAEMDRIASGLRAAKPDLVYVALGFPKQEHLIRRIRSAAPQAWYLGVGISFSYLCGEVRMAPRWMRRTGLEWVYRLAQEPKRLARRYLRDDIPFALRLGGLASRRRLFGAGSPDIARHAR